MEIYFQLITDAETLRRVCEELGREDFLGFDTETTALDPYDGTLRLVQLSTGKDTKVIDLKPFAERGDLRTSAELAPLRDLLSAPKPIKIAHNAKFDAKWISHHLGAQLGGTFDTLLASQLIAAGDQDRRHSLGEVTSYFLGTELDKSEQVSDWSAPELSQSQIEYAARDAATMIPLREKIVEKLKSDELIKVAKLEFDCVVPIAQMELNGFYLDEARWREQLERVKVSQAKVALELQQMLAAGVAQASLFGMTEINLDSQTQVTDALKNLGVPVPATTRGWQLQPLAADYPVIAKLLEYRGVAKSLSSFGENILEFINKKTGRIHADFRQIGAPTGRFSCSKPNIQQIPHEENYRRCFRAADGKKLVIADYCVARGTRIATKRGLIPIEEIRLSDQVCLENGSTTRISAIIQRGKLPVVKLTLRNGYSLTATKFHRIRVIDSSGNYVWRRIGELEKTDFVVIQSARGISQRKDYEMLPVIEFNHHNNIAFSTPDFADENFALFFGYVCGDGSFAKRTIKWVVNEQDVDVASQIDELAAKLFGLSVHQRAPYRGVFESMLCSTPLVSWCHGIGIGKDRVPEFLWKSKSSVVTAFLRGLFEADGSVTANETGKVSFTSSRSRLACEVHQLLLALGIPATLREQTGTGPGKKFKCWSVSIVSSGLKKFADEIGFLSARKQQKLNALLALWTGKTIVGNMPNLSEKIRSLHLSGEARRLLNNTTAMGRPVSVALALTIEQNYPNIAQSLDLKHLTHYKQLFLPIVSIENVGEEEVYDLSVPGPTTYISDGFVSHNSQVELRILAEFSKDQNFIDAFVSGEDFHTTAAAQVFNVKPEEVTSEQRSFAKRLNFGVVYGIGSQRFALMTGLSQSNAEDIMRKYFATYRGLDSWLRDAARKVITDRAARTASGRLARFRFDEEDRKAISLAQRNGKNMPIQGCVSGNTKIFEKNFGYVKIEKLAGRAVSVWDGERFAKAKVAYSGKKQLVKVEFWGGNYIECSPNHKFLTIDVNGRTSWRTPSEFVKGNYVVLTEAVNDWQCNLELPKFEAGKSHNASRASLSNLVNAPDELGEWLGRLASDGSTTNHQLYLLVAEHEKEILSKLKKSCQTFGHVYERTGGGGKGTQPIYSLTISALGLAKQVQGSGIKYKIPDFVWQNSRLLAGYLRGMFDGDGTVNRDGAILTFGKGGYFYLDWAREIQQALLLFGIRGRLNQCGDRINVCILKRDMPIFSKRIGFINSQKQKKAEAIFSNQHQNKIYGRAVRIKSVEITDEWIDMFDVVDSETSKFMANGLITHNSSADILKRALHLLHQKISGTSARLVNIVHDEIIVEADAAESQETADKLEKAMCAAGEEYISRVPVKVDVKISDEWSK